MPASEAIASDVGHGALGVRSGLRPFRDLLSESVAQRHLWIELRPKLVVSGWTSDGGGLYHKTVGLTDHVWDGILLDVVGCQTLAETLVRVEAPSLCTAGRFYWNGGFLYVHLTGDADPALTTVAVQVGLHLGSHGVYQPVLLPDRLANGTLEAWTGSVPDGWSHAEDVGVTLDKTTSDPLQGSYAARLTLDMSALAGAGGSLFQDFTTLVAGAYRFGGAYRNTCPGNALYALARIVDGALGTYYLSPNGRDVAAGVGSFFLDGAGHGEWRRFAFDFLCPSWATVRTMLRGQVAVAGQGGTIDFDDVHLQRISRYAYHEPLLTRDTAPTIEAARADAFWGEMSAALSSMTIANARWEALLASYDWIGAEAIVRVGGRFQLGGNEIMMDDCPVIG